MLKEQAYYTYIDRNVGISVETYCSNYIMNLTLTLKILRNIDILNVI